MLFLLSDGSYGSENRPLITVLSVRFVQISCVPALASEQSSSGGISARQGTPYSSSSDDT